MNVHSMSYLEKISKVLYWTTLQFTSSYSVICDHYNNKTHSLILLNYFILWCSVFLFKSNNWTTSVFFSFNAQLGFFFRWNQLDIGIVILSIVGIALEEVESKIIPINPTIIRVMRVLRIARGKLILILFDQSVFLSNKFKLQCTLQQLHSSRTSLA